MDSSWHPLFAMGAIEDGLSARRAAELAQQEKVKREARDLEARRRKAEEEADYAVAEFIRMALARGLKPDVRLPRVVEQSWYKLERPDARRLGPERRVDLGIISCWNLHASPESPIGIAYPHGKNHYYLSEDGCRLVAVATESMRRKLFRPNDLIRTVSWEERKPSTSDVVHSFGGGYEESFTQVHLIEAMVNWLRIRGA